MQFLIDNDRKKRRLESILTTIPEFKYSKSRVANDNSFRLSFVMELQEILVSNKHTYSTVVKRNIGNLGRDTLIKAVHNSMRESNSLFTANRFSTMEGLIASFSWQDTIEGYSFWHNHFNNMRQI